MKPNLPPRAHGRVSPTPLLLAATILAALALSLTVSPRSQAADDSAAAALVDGTWKWTFTMPDGGKVEPKARLKIDGNTITGTTTIRPGQEATITAGRLDGNSIAWSVVRQHNGRKATTRYQGTLDGDTIKGSIESDWAGETRRYDWEARRAPNTPTGTWRWAAGMGRPGPPGAGGARATRGEGVGTFKLEGDKVTGKITFLGRDLPIKHGRFVQDELSFEVTRQREGETFTTHYRGKVRGDVIRGETESDLGRETRARPWEATRVEE